MNFEYKNNDYISAKEFNLLIKDYAKVNNVNYYDIPYSKGKMLTKTQRIVKLGYKYLNKLVEYEEKERICGEDRNSY